MAFIAFSPLLHHPVPMLREQIGANIYAARKAKKMSSTALAEKVEPKTSYQHIRRLEKGDPALDFEWVERIASALHVEPMELIAPGAGQAPQGFRLDEQVANEVAQTLAEVALGGDEPESGTVQAISLLLQELNATFAVHHEAATDVQVVRPLLTLASRRFGPAAN